jgi:glutamate---cysteine ligase / carboxylate-amine ligase
MLTFFGPVLEAQGDWIEEADLVRTTLDHGNSARRQLWAFAQAGRFEDVVDLILRETALGL